MQEQTSDASQAWVPRAPDLSYWTQRWPEHLSWSGWPFILRLLSYIQLSQLLLLALACYLISYALKARYKAELANQRARWQQISDNQQQFTVAESFTLGWLNVLLRHLWPTVLEKEVCDKATVVLKETIDKILKTKGEKAPLKYVEHIEVEEFTMGMVPPRFHFCHARYNPTRNYLQLEADMAFRSSGFQLVIAPAVRAHALLPRVSGRVAVTHVNMSGRMLIGLHLFSRAPGIKGVDMSFVHPPEVDMKFSPFGMTITEIPGILTALKDAIQKSMSKDMVEPKRKYVDMEATYKKHLLNKAGGPGGLLLVTIVQARDLRYRGMTVSNMKQIDAYCEMRYKAQVFRTPCVRGSGNPAWNWQFEVQLAAPEGGHGPGTEGDFQIRVLDAKALGDPGLLGTADISLTEAQLQPNAGPRNSWMPLKGSPQATIQLQMTLLAKEALGQPELASSSDARLQAAFGQAGRGDLVKTGKPARGLDVVEDKTELASLLEAEKSRRRLLEQRFSTAQEEADKLRGRLKDLQGVKKNAKSGEQRAEERAQHGSQGLRPQGMARRRATADTAANHRGPGQLPEEARRKVGKDQTTARGEDDQEDDQDDEKMDDNEQQHGTVDRLRAEGTSMMQQAAQKQGEDTSDADTTAEEEPLANSATDQVEADYGRPKDGLGRVLSQHDLQTLAVEQASPSKEPYAGVKAPNAAISSPPGPLALLVKVSKLEKVLKEERSANERQISELEAYAGQLEMELELEQKRRLSDQLRALIEGAPFLLYKSSEVQERHVWYSVASNTLRWAQSRTAVPGAAKTHRNGEPKNKERSIEVKKILKVETGSSQFPGSSSTKGWEQLKSIIPFGATKKAPERQQDADDDKAFTVVFTGNSAIHLVANGNGRSRDEWVAAIQDLANGCYKQMLHPGDKDAAQEEA